LEFVSKNSRPAETSISSPSSPPWALTTCVQVLSSVTIPSLEVRERRTGTFNLTLSLLRLFATCVVSVRFFWWSILAHPGYQVVAAIRSFQITCSYI
jgi:hypothetical protein